MYTKTKFGIYVHPKRPKIPLEKLIKHITSAGASHSDSEPDIAIVVGGDGTFGYHGRRLSIPILFVGINDTNILGSKAKLAEIFYNDLTNAISKIQIGKYLIDKRKMFSVTHKGKSEDVLTDVYLERGIFSGCIRYTVKVMGKKTNGNKNSFSEYAIGNGVIISSSFGSGGYYSYPDRLRMINLGKRQFTTFSDNKIGICHIVPAFLVRQINRKQVMSRRIRYSFPFHLSSSSPHKNRPRIEIGLAREDDTRLYGTTSYSQGVQVKMEEKVTIRPSSRYAKIIRLKL